MRITWLWIGATIICGALLSPDAVCANGGVHKTLLLKASFTLDDRDTTASEMVCEIAPVLYSVATLKNKYRVLQITVHNSGTSALLMSKTKDALSLAYESEPARKVTAVLDLAAADASLWSSLPLDVREILAYPTRVEHGEEKTVFAFVPLKAPATAPDVLKYALAALPTKTIELVQRKVAKS